MNARPSAAAAAPRSVLLAGLVTFLVYLPTFSNGFTNWDDDLYVTANRFVQRLSAANLLHHFTSFTCGTYHPLTLLVYSLEYHLFGPSPQVFHGLSLLIHLLNVLLVFILARRLGADARASGVAALVFGIHPLHVESVAWASELKDVLCGSFFLAAILAYLAYLREQRRPRWYALSLLLFLLALLSKPMAVTLPFVLLLCDFLRGRRWERGVFLEKAPFLALSLVFGALALLSQQGALRRGDGLGLADNLLVASHGLLFYLSKAVVPAGLSALYLVPAKVDGSLPPAYSFAPLLLLPLAALAAFFGRRSRMLAFSSLFFLITLLPVLQIVPFGSAAAADRYFYLPSFGLCLAAGVGFSRLVDLVSLRHPRGRALLLLGGAAVLAAYAGIAHERLGVWKDSFSLWNDVIAKDSGSYVAYGYRGMAHATAGAYEPAVADFQRALALGAGKAFSAEVYFNRGALQQIRQQLPEALADYDRALAVDPGAVRALLNRGNVLDTLGRREEALQDYQRGILLEPDNPLLYYNRGLVYQRSGDDAQAVLDYDEALRLDPWFAAALLNRGVSLARLGQFGRAIEDFTGAAALEPDAAAAYEYRSRAYAAIGNREQAERDRERARALAGGSRGAALP